MKPGRSSEKYQPIAFSNSRSSGSPRVRKPPPAICMRNTQLASRRTLSTSSLLKNRFRRANPRSRKRSQVVHNLYSIRGFRKAGAPSIAVVSKFGESKPRIAKFIAVVEHILLVAELDDVRILYHFRVPALRRNVDAGTVVHAHPRDAISGLGVADAIACFRIRSIVRPAAVRVPHVIKTVLRQNGRAHNSGFRVRLV